MGKGIIILRAVQYNETHYLKIASQIYVAYNSVGIVQALRKFGWALEA